MASSNRGLIWNRKKTAEKLKNLKINTIEDLATADKHALYPYFKNQTEYIINIANGIDLSLVVSEIHDPKCISSTYTLMYDYDDINEINKELKKISNNLGIELRNQNKYTGTIAIIIKDTNFKTTTHQEKMKNSTNSSDTIFEISKKLFKEHWNETPVRLIGIRLDTLTTNKDYQISLFENIQEKENNETLDKTIDYLKKKFGDKIIK